MQRARVWHQPATGFLPSCPMRNSLLLACSLTSACAACYPGYRPCPCAQPNVRKKIYNQALTGLVERYFYPAYLPTATLPVMDFQPRLQDSTSHAVQWYHQQLAIAQNRLFGDTARFKTLYLDTVGRRRKRLVDAAERAFWQKFIRPAGIAPQNIPAAIDSLTTLQSMMEPADFQTCTFRVRLSKPRQPVSASASIGRVYLSNLVLHPRHHVALLAYDYHCGGNCGFSGALLLREKDSNWHIERNEILGIY